MYYRYIQKLDVGTIGFCIVINGIGITDLNYLFEVFEDAVNIIKRRKQILNKSVVDEDLLYNKERRDSK